MEQKRMKKNSKGITLIALVITIIVLLILAGVSISTLTGKNGILAQAGNSKTQTEIGEEKEQIGLAYNGAIVENIGGSVTAGDLNTQFTKNAVNATATGEGTITVTFPNTNRSYTIDSNGNITGPNTGGNTLPSTAGTTPYFPSSKFSQVAGTSLDNGLVIRDNVGNEYVWIEVPNDGTRPDYSGVSSNADYDNIETALQSYASKYRNSSYNDVWYDGNGYPATEIPSSGSASDSASGSGTTISSDLEDTSGCGLTYVQYTTLKNKMLTSIYENGGFWIGRYEAGISEPRTEHTDVTTSTTIKALSQPNQYPLNYVYCSESQILASKVATDAGLENYTSSLMFGIQWDLVLTYLENKGTSYDDLAINSTSWGNYYNNLWTITNTSAKYALHTVTTSLGSWTSGAYGTKSSISNILLSTGADSSFSKMNIFDLAGNVDEFTLERYGTGSFGRCISRGGGCSGNGSDYPASNRSQQWYDPFEHRLRVPCLTLLVALNADSDKL